MIKIESDNNIAVVSMDEYNRGLSAIHELGELKTFMLCEITDKGTQKYRFVKLLNYSASLEYKQIHYHDGAVFTDDDYQNIIYEVNEVFKIALDEKENSLIESEKLLKAKQRAFCDNLKKAKNIKWYHLLFGWKALEL